MSLPIVFLPKAAREIDAAMEYLALHASPATALRLRRAIEKTALELSDMPEIGSRWERPGSRLTEVRAWPVKKFKNYVLYYRIHEDQLEILRLVHGAQDLEQRLQDLE